MSNGSVDRLVRTVVSTYEWCKRQRAPKGGALLLRQARRLLGQAVSEIEQSSSMSHESREKLLHTLAVLGEFLDLIR